MKKILLAIDGPSFPESAFRFIEQVNETQKVLLIGTVVPAFSRYAAMNLEPMAEGIAYDSTLFHKHEDEVARTVNRFKTLCEHRNIEYRIHQEPEYDVFQYLRKESRFADLLVIGSEVFYKTLGCDHVNSYLHNVLQEVECPVLLIPDNYVFPDNVILAYDGSESSVYAIKQFTYLFPEFTELSTLLVYASENETEIPDLPYIEELAARHYSRITICNPKLGAKEYFSSWIGGKKRSLLVMGSYGRSDLSEAFRESVANDVIAHRQLPVFIAHK